MNRRTIYIMLMGFALTFLLCQCKEKDNNALDGYGSEYPQTTETFAAIDSCMNFMHSDPGKAHHMLDSLRKAKIISPQRCDYLHATVVFTGEGNADSALVVCNRLLDERKFGDDEYLEEDICVLAANITTSIDRCVETLKYANRGIAICHGNESMRSDEVALMGRVGEAEYMLGHTDKARETYDKAYELLSEDNTFGGLIARISLMMKQARLHREVREYDKAVGVCNEVLGLVQRFDRDPSFVEQRPETMNESGEGTRDFADFYESQMYSSIASVYREKIEHGLSSNKAADTDSINAYLDKWKRTSSSSSPVNKSRVMREFLFTGRISDFAMVKDAVGESYQGDTIVSGYVEYLRMMSEYSAAIHDQQASTAYLARAVVVSDSIRQHDLLRTLSEQMSINMVQEQQLARQDAENQVSRQRLVIFLLSALLAIIVAAGFVIAFLMRKNMEKKQIIETTQHDLTETKKEVKELSRELEAEKAEKAVNNTQALYERIVQAVEDDKLYLNPDLDIRILAEQIGSSRTLISVCINKVTGKTFRQWLSEYRLSLFDRMLKDNPEAPIDQLARQCGYQDQSTFRRQFKTAFGMSPGEYRKQTYPEGHGEGGGKDIRPLPLP